MATNKADQMAGMDDAAEKAEAALKEGLQNGAISTARELVGWMEDWYIEAGYKRLSRVMRKLLGQST